GLKRRNQAPPGHELPHVPRRARPWAIWSLTQLLEVCAGIVMAAAQPVFPAERFSVVPDTVPYHKPLVLSLLVLSVLRLWISPIGTSLWLDETVTYWSAYKGVAAALTRSQFWPGQNFAYTLISALAMRIAGRSEIVLRLPSLFAALVTTWLLYRIG